MCVYKHQSVTTAGCDDKIENTTNQKTKKKHIFDIDFIFCVVLSRVSANGDVYMPVGFKTPTHKLP